MQQQTILSNLQKNDCLYPLIWMFAVHLYMVLILTFKTARNKYDIFEEIPLKMQMFTYDSIYR